MAEIPKNKKGSIPGWILTGLSVGKELIENDDVQKMVLGTYSDGSVRSIPDAIDGEIYSPKQQGKAIKRNNNIKDFGKLIPGHGGMIDRIDSVLFTAPITYYLVMLFNIV